MPKIAKTKRNNRFTKPTYSQNIYNNFSFGKAIKSFKNDELFFTNFVKNKHNKCLDLLENYYLYFSYENFYFFEDDFLPLDDVKYSYKTADRLLKIINKGYKNKYKVDDLKYIFKMKHRKYKGFQFYVFKSRNNLTLILIDFFHLAIPAKKYLPNGEIIDYDLDRDYNKQKNNSYDIGKIL